MGPSGGVACAHPWLGSLGWARAKCVTNSGHKLCLTAMRSLTPKQGRYWTRLGGVFYIYTAYPVICSENPVSQFSVCSNFGNTCQVTCSKLVTNTHCRRLGEYLSMACCYFTRGVGFLTGRRRPPRRWRGVPSSAGSLSLTHTLSLTHSLSLTMPIVLVAGLVLEGRSSGMGGR